MTILAQDIKLRPSRVMADVPEGGGGPAPGEIGFGDSNTVFDDISSIARTMGEVSIRQLHMHVDTADTDRLLGAYAVVAKLPADPNVSVTLATCAPFARRSEISQAIADYLIRGVPWNGFLLGNHVKGQANIQIFQRPGSATPTIGRTLVLIVDEGLPAEKVEWVRVIKVDSAVQTFTDDKGDYQALVVQCDLQSGLTQALPGTDPTRYFVRGAGKAMIRDTTAADAANYYGAAALGVAGAVGDVKLKVGSVYSQLVPSSSTAVPALDQRPAAQRVLTLAATPRQVDVPATPHTRRYKISPENRGLSYVFQLTPLPEPGSVTVTYVALGNRYTAQDDGAGALTGSAAGTLNAATGSLAVTLPALPDVGSAVVVQWGERVAYTNRSSQGAQVRAPEYVWVLEGDGMLEPGSLTLEYTSGGAVRSCTVSADGTIGGAGTGHVDNPSKTVQFRPQYMIDAGGEIACDYQLSTQQTDILAPGAPDAGGFITLNLDAVPAAGTVEVSWATAQEVTSTSGGTASSTKTHTGGGTSSVRAVQYVPQTQWTGQLTSIGISTTPGSGGVDFGPGFNNGGTQYVDVKTETSTSGSASYSTATGRDGATRVVVMHRATDDGAGHLPSALGTVDYSGKAISLKVVDYTRSTDSYKSDYESASEFNSATSGPGAGSSGAAGASKGGSYATTAVGEQLLASSSVVVRYKTGAVTPVAAAMTYTPPDVVIDLCPYTGDRIVPGSVRFTWMGHVYEDREGTLYRDPAGASPGTASGSVDYAAGLARMSDYVVGGTGPADLTLQSLWTSKATWRTASVFFMTSASPIQPGQITITCLDVAGNLLTVDCDLSGNLTGPHASGKFEFQNGLGELQFGDFVLDSGLTTADKAEWWYDPADVGAVQAGKIWRPWPIDPASLRYNAVSTFYLPVDPVILGLDPVRLPQDGRVPIFRKGRILVIGHNAQLAPATYAASDTIDCGRTRLSHVWLIGADGKLITSGFSADESDLDAGLIHVTDTAGWAQPVTVEHRVQDMALCTDVQIDGTLGINIPLSHTYPVGSVVSSAVLYGTTFARVANTFDQQTWDGITWKDSVQGSPATGTYNDTAYPIVVTNAGALSDRYALRIKSDATTFDFLSEHMGSLGAGSINADFAPNSPVKPGVPTPLFEIKAAGWGGSWVAGNVVFLGIQAAMQSMAVIRTVQPGTPSGVDYSFDLLTGGDIDRPPSAP